MAGIDLDRWVEDGQGRVDFIGRRKVSERVKEMALKRREIMEYKEEAVNGQVLGEEIYRQVEDKSPIYYSPQGFTCVCGNFMCQEPPNPKTKTVIVFCTNPMCSENLISKQFVLPALTEYQVLPS
jgi:hypothetical protein